MSFSEIVKQQIQERTKDTVIKFIKEKEELVRDMVDKKKCFVIFGLKEKVNRVKFNRDKEDKELARNVIRKVQDDNQQLEVEIEEINRMGKYNEGGKRPLKVKMRSQATVEEILARAGKLAGDEEYKDVWLKRDMSQEEREREKNLRSEARLKNDQRTEQRKRYFTGEYWTRN